VDAGKSADPVRDALERVAWFLRRQRVPRAQVLRDAAAELYKPDVDLSAEQSFAAQAVAV
jgi:hypothetical protein